jgi:lipopolysaccharide/colanic/teichoic acid biosynthesis glycosyltransferase
MRPPGSSRGLSSPHGVDPIRAISGAQFAKRAFDLVIAGVMLLVLIPVLIVVAIVIASTMGRPVIFAHERPGRDGRPFRMFKFRTMREPRVSEDRYLSDAQRITRLGALLRRTSLDELPELWNVLRGDMSLVGPRPLLMRYQPFYTPRERARFTVRPGITGLAQVRGRNTLSWDERLALDVQYVEQWNPTLDLQLLVETLRIVVCGSGVVVDPRSAMRNLDEERAMDVTHREY